MAVLAVTSKSMRYGRTSLSPSVNRYRPERVDDGRLVLLQVAVLRELFELLLQMNHQRERSA